MGGAVAAAAASAQARRRVISVFMSQNAVSAEQAVPFTAGKRLEQKIFERLRNENIVMPGGNGGYWLDIPKWDAWTHRQNVKARWAVLVAVVVMAIGLSVALALGSR